MKLVGVCHLCGKPAMQTCVTCGLVTCRACLDNYSGICSRCAPPPPEEDGEDYEDDY